MNWDAVGALAELVGATGVIASLIFVGFQVRGSIPSSRTRTWHRASSTWWRAGTRWTRRIGPASCT